jgi:ATP-dependent exoDNAse (exonuclease V) beta subunit
MKIGGWAPQDLHDHEDDEVSRDLAEGVRLAYVAATRARDLLVVPVLGDEPWEGGWFGPLNRALYPPVESRRTATRGRRCPTFPSKDSVLERPNEETAGQNTVCPGEYSFASDDHDHYGVVWWDPHSLDLDKKPAFGVRREDLIVKDVPRHVVADGRSAYDRWRLARADARAAGVRESIAVRTVREWAADEGAADFDILPETMTVRLKPDPTFQADASRPGGQAFGLLMHNVLARTPLDADRTTVEDVASVEARLLGLGRDAIDAAVTAVEAVLSHDILRRAREAGARGRCRRETPLTLQLSDGTLLEGIVDLAFEEDGRWLVVDYKTDRELAEDPEGNARYTRQVGAYAAAISRATGQPASGVVLRI